MNGSASHGGSVPGLMRAFNGPNRGQVSLLAPTKSDLSWWLRHDFLPLDELVESLYSCSSGFIVKRGIEGFLPMLDEKPCGVWPLGLIFHTLGHIGMASKIHQAAFTVLAFTYFADVLAIESSRWASPDDVKSSRADAQAPHHLPLEATRSLH